MKSPDNRALSQKEIDAFGSELDALRNRVLETLGERDARYIRRVRDAVRWTSAGGRSLLFAGVLPPAWVTGTLLLSLSKILENMELGHNVMHGQYDWMHDPEFQSRTYDWDNVCPAEAWRHSHNYLHHTFTNIDGRDRDLGYGLLRLFPEQEWHPRFLLQPLYALGLAIIFEWGVALHDLELDRILSGEKSLARLLHEVRPILRKAARQVAKDYVVFPALAGPFFAAVLAGNATANVIRNLWAFVVIFCGHFTDGVQTFPDSTLENETRGQWYLRQLQGSSNLEGSPLLHIMTGNLSHQIEHHLFPDVPASRYAEMAKEVKHIAAKYGQHYESGPLGRQFAAVVRRIFRHSLPSNVRHAAAVSSRIPRSFKQRAATTMPRTMTPEPS